MAPSSPSTTRTASVASRNSRPQSSSLAAGWLMLRDALSAWTSTPEGRSASANAPAWRSAIATLRRLQQHLGEVDGFQHNAAVDLVPGAFERDIEIAQ